MGPAPLSIAAYAPEPPVCHAYDPVAPEVAGCIGDQITAMLPGVTVEHIGSTAVPGCAGKGVVDLMVIYSDGQLEAVKELLANLGFQRQTVGQLLPEARPMRVGAVEYGGRRFQLHVHAVLSSSPEIEALRSFREQLRTDPRLVATYVAWKRAILAEGITDRKLYTQRKSVFVQAVLAQAPLEAKITMATILIVDDHPHILRLLRRELAAASHHVLTALSGEEALTQVLQEHPALIILDVALPGKSGLEVLQALKTNPTTRAIPVVLLSAQDQPDDMAKGLEMGADWYVTKPFRPGDISLLIRRFLAEADTAVTGDSHEANVPLPFMEQDRRLDLLAREARGMAIPA